MACAVCVQRQPIKDLRQLHIGDHIEFGRFSIIKTLLNVVIPEIDLERLHFGYFYFHHAIVSEINHAGQYIKLIEFAPKQSSQASYHKSQRKAVISERHINFSDIHGNMHAFLVIHTNIGQHPPTPRDIVKNARHLLQKAESERYNVLLNNCEHMANLCVTQRRISLQVRCVTDGLISRLLRNRPLWFKMLLGTLWKKLLKLIAKIEKALEKISKLHAIFDFVKRFLGKWLGCTFAITVVFMALQIFQFYSVWKDTNPCPQCFKAWVVKLIWQSLSMLLSTKITYLISIGVCFSGFLPYECLFKNQTDSIRLKSLRTIRPGDVITFNLYMPFSFHDAIVVDWELQLTAGNMRKLTKPFSTMSEDEEFELLTSLIDELFSIENYLSNERLDIYVQMMRAEESLAAIEPIQRQRIDEFLNMPRRHIQKTNGRWNEVLNRRNDLDIPKVHFLVDEKNIKLYHNLSGSCRVEIVHYDLERGLRFPDVLFRSSRVVKFETKTLSMGDKHTVYRKKYKISDAYKNLPDVIVERAVARQGERKWHLIGNWSSHLVTECVVVNLDTYYNRGYRFARLVQNGAYNFLCADLTQRCSGFELIDSLMNVCINKISSP